MPGTIVFHAGDMLDPKFGRFDHVVGMDSLIHYRAGDIMRALTDFADRTRVSIVFTIAPRTPMLSLMHAAGRLFPRGSRAPAIEPLREVTIAGLLRSNPAMPSWSLERTNRITSGFYTSQAFKLVKQ